MCGERTNERLFVYVCVCACVCTFLCAVLMVLKMVESSKNRNNAELSKQKRLRAGPNGAPKRET